MSNYYPIHQNFLLKRLEKKLDEFFYDVHECTNPIICEKKLLNVDPKNTNALKEQYEVEPNKILRFDHTHLMLNGFPYIVPNINIKNVGPVFRKGPTSGYRWKQFYQYDVDYVYENHYLRPLKMLIKALDCLVKDKYELKINDLQILKNSLNSSIAISENNIKDILANNPIDISTYKEKVLKKYPLLKDYNVIIDPSLVRGWNYYDDFVFEVQHKNIAFCGGGMYFNPGVQRKYFGLSIGMNRLLKIMSENNISIYLKAFESHVLVYNLTKELPDELLDRLELEKINYYLKSKKQTSLNDITKVNTALNKIGKFIGAIIFYGSQDQVNNSYSCRLDQVLHKNLTLDELIKVLKS